MLLTREAATALEDSAALAAANLDSRFEIAAATEAVVVEVVAAGCCQRFWREKLKFKNYGQTLVRRLSPTNGYLQGSR